TRRHGGVLRVACCVKQRRTRPLSPQLSTLNPSSTHPGTRSPTRRNSPTQTRLANGSKRSLLSRNTQHAATRNSELGTRNSERFLFPPLPLSWPASPPSSSARSTRSISVHALAYCGAAN